ncbi:MAG: hypothetical protein PHD95_04135 [Candidatus ainarchaeum sp.]|nr:hypothetical protein [Candidatus ainarchaeum sp.]
MDDTQVQQKKSPLVFISIILVVAVVCIAAFVFLQQFLPQNSVGNFLVSNDAQSDVINPSQFVSREDYFREVFKPHRNQYGLFGKAADFLKKPVSEIPAYFGLNNEQEIFEALPEIPSDFSDIAYLLAQGKYFDLGLLDERYYKQPEFYDNFKTLGVRYWTRPDPKYWVANGYGTYPAEQWDSLQIGQREDFKGVVFFYSSWGVQSFQGVSLSPDSESQKYFDIQITPKTFLLEPSFPKFGKNWAYKIEIAGKLKPNTPPGVYHVGINVEVPPNEFRSKWALEHKNIYFDAANAIRPAGNQIQFDITVK